MLNHTGNFGEEKLCKLFDRDTQLRNQAYIDACMTPTETLGSDYLTILPKDQYHRRLTMMKNMDGQNRDIHNYWHHYGQFGWMIHPVGGVRLLVTVLTSIQRTTR